MAAVLSHVLEITTLLNESKKIKKKDKKTQLRSLKKNHGTQH